MATATPATPNTATRIKGIDIHAYLVKDAPTAVAFYRDTLGLPVSAEFPQGAEFELADGATFGVWQMSDGTWHPHGGVMFAVEDVDQAYALYKSRGVKFFEEPFDTETCRMVAGADPDGNTFLLHQRKVRSS